MLIEVRIVILLMWWHCWWSGIAGAVALLVDALDTYPPYTRALYAL